MTVLFSSAGRRVGLMRCFREALAETGLDGRIVAADAARHARHYAAFGGKREGGLALACAEDGLPFSAWTTGTDWRSVVVGHLGGLTHV